jgi:hypothetical protein
MQHPPESSIKLWWLAFAALAIGSLGLKAMAGPAPDGLVGSDPTAFEKRATSILRSQHFTIRWQAFPARSTLIFAQRGDCRIAVRSAMWGSGFAPIFAADASSVGHVVYLFAGQDYAKPPELRMRISRLQTEALNRLGARRSAPVVVAFAASPACGDANFGLADVSLRA